VNFVGEFCFFGKNLEGMNEKMQKKWTKKRSKNRE
jgi:hypothetical protein